MTYIKTDTYLDNILARKAEEIAQMQAMMPAAVVERQSLDRQFQQRDFATALRRNTVALIAEVKKASPSKGILLEDFDPARIGQTYADNGAAAISVLTDKDFFQGELAYLEQVRQVASLPILRKDFIIDPYQVHFMRATHITADAVLLIVAALDDAQLADLHSLIIELGMTPLVEVHDEAELERALKIGAQVIGVNNRNLKTFAVDLNITAQIAQHVPADVTLVAESGIRNADDVRHMGKLGAHAVLVGEHLVKAADMAAQVRSLSSQPRP